MRLIMCLLAAFLTLALPARADSLSAQDEADFRAIISDQIAAFEADDGPRAYSHAAPMIRQIFPDPERFMGMVKQGYPPVYRPQVLQLRQGRLLRFRTPHPARHHPGARRPDL